MWPCSDWAQVILVVPLQWKCKIKYPSQFRIALKWVYKTLRLGTWSSLSVGPTPVGAFLPFHLSMGLFSGAFTKLWKVTIGFVTYVCLSACPSVWNESVPRRRISVKFDIRVFFGTVSRKLKLYVNMTRLTGTLHADLSTFIISRWIILGMRNVWDKSYTENQNTTFCVQKTFLRKSGRLFDNLEKYCNAL